MCLEYEDVFSNELALRLARRLFCAITARRCFADIAECDLSLRDNGSDFDVLRPLLSQLDLLSNEPARVLDFTPAERLLHETRVPTLLLDWARAVLLREWDGRPEFSSDGPFHGALSLVATLCKIGPCRPKIPMSLTPGKTKTGTCSFWETFSSELTTSPSGWTLWRCQ